MPTAPCCCSALTSAACWRAANVRAPFPLRARHLPGLSLLLCAALLAPTAGAQALPCAEIENNSQRLACYDSAAGRQTTARPLAAPAATAALGAEENTATAPQPTRRPPPLSASLAERWELSGSSSHGIWSPRPYKPVYLLPLSMSDGINAAPASPSAGHQAGTAVDWDQAEAKFQLSLKTKLVEGVFGDTGNLWGGYTQTSRWQVYNQAISRPFRETNYEPEVMLVFDTPYSLLGWQGRMAGLSLNHQSNGRAQPLSRSWNRVIAEVALERGDWTLSLRPWWRVREAGEVDDNPDIEDFIGRGELLLGRKIGQHLLTLQARHSLRAGDAARGSLQLEWSFPLANGVRGYLQAFSGHGESLLDYNFRENRIGVGVALVEWR
ncbi:MAG: phospholipase A [Rhodoferax sp.]|nr:phospholipase A [Rhodoferax sp.]